MTDAKKKAPRYRLLNGAINGPQISTLVDKLAVDLDELKDAAAPVEASSVTAMWKVVNELKARVEALEKAAAKP